MNKYSVNILVDQVVFTLNRPFFILGWIVGISIFADTGVVNSFLDVIINGFLTLIFGSLILYLIGERPHSDKEVIK